MQHWEYKSEIISSPYLADHDLNQLGKEGWELVGIYKDDGSWYAVLKRPY